MFNIINFLAITVQEEVPFVTPEDLAQLEKETQGKTVWLVILLCLLAVEIFFAAIYPKLRAKSKLKKQAKEKRKAQHREKR